MNHVEKWLDAHAGAAPPSLRSKMTEAVRGATEDSVPDALVGAAFSQLAHMLQNPRPRSAAFELLSADALLTYAFEAAAEQGSAAVARLADSLSPERFTQLLTPQ